MRIIEKCMPMKKGATKCTLLERTARDPIIAVAPDPLL
jgi:hypothetical protein